MLKVLLGILACSAQLQAKDIVKVKVGRMNHLQVLSKDLKLLANGKSELSSDQADIRFDHKQNKWLIAANDTNKSLETKSIYISASQSIDSSVGAHLPGKLSLHARSNKSYFDLVAHLDMENYLKGVLPSEMPASWPLEALKAQAIAARTYALKRLEDRKGAYAVKNNIYDQVYDLKNFKILRSVHKRKVLRAIRETAGQVLVDPESKELITAYYHADCGGSTEKPFYVWGDHEAFSVTTDKSCPLSPHANWELEITKKHIQPLADHFGFQVDQVKDLRAYKRTSSGRVRQVVFELDNDKHVYVTSNDFRRLIGFKTVKSTKFLIYKKQESSPKLISWAKNLFMSEAQAAEKTPNKEGHYLLTGQGHGHGVGLCQWGSKYKASKGMKYKDIINHYYSHAEIYQRK